MKKSLVFLALAASIASVNLQAQEQTGGVSSSTVATGAVTGGVIAAGTVATIITAALVVNSNGSSPERPIIELPIILPPLTCNGDDALVDGVCINNSVTTTVTGTGTGTATTTITVPVSSTYAPTR